MLVSTKRETDLYWAVRTKYYASWLFYPAKIYACKEGKLNLPV